MVHAPHACRRLWWLLRHSRPCSTLAAPAWAMASPFRGSFLLCWFRCASGPPKWVWLVVPASLLASPGGLGPRVGCSTLGLSQPHVRIDRLGVAVRVRSCGLAGQRRSHSRTRQPRQFRGQAGSADIQPDNPSASWTSQDPAGQSKRRLDKPRSSRISRHPSKVSCRTCDLKQTHF